MLDNLDKLGFKCFEGRVVRKDLVRKLKVGYNVPSYVLEYLLGRYCGVDDEEEIARGLQSVKDILEKHYVSPDESEKIKAIIRENGMYRIIDKISVKLDDRRDRYWAELLNMGLKEVNIGDELVKKNDKLLGSGMWAILDIGYDTEMYSKGGTRPFVIKEIIPIQMASLDLQEIKEGRSEFNTEEWMDFVLRSVGYEPNEMESQRVKLLFISRLIPLCEANFNLIELGPRGTGKSYVYREVSPYSILVSGGKTTVANLFYNMSSRQIGLVGYWDTVAFDEVGGLKFGNSDAIQIMKDYMESGSFSRGKEEIGASGSMVFIGNINGNIERISEISHLFTPLVPEMRDDTAFQDRLHFFLPGWEIPKMYPELFTSHLGLIADYFSEFLKEMRKVSYTDIIDNYFRFGKSLNQRDVKAVRKTVSGLVKILHPDGEFTKNDIENYLIFAMEMRRRVKEQMKKIGGLEFWATSFSYIDIESGQEKFVTLKEKSGGKVIPENNLSPGEVYTVGIDLDTQKPSVFKIEVQTTTGSGILFTGSMSKAMKDAANNARTYIMTHAKSLGVEKQINECKLHINAINLMQSKEGSETGMAFFVAIMSSLTGKYIKKQIVVLGEMSNKGTVSPVSNLIEALQVSLDAGAKTIIVPMNNLKEIAGAPQDLMASITPDFYQTPETAIYKSLILE
jgi:ATP-dependent Lon protease